MLLRPVFVTLCAAYLLVSHSQSSAETCYVPQCDINGTVGQYVRWKYEFYGSQGTYTNRSSATSVFRGTDSGIKYPLLIESFSSIQRPQSFVEDRGNLLTCGARSNDSRVNGSYWIGCEDVLEWLPMGSCGVQSDCEIGSYCDSQNVCKDCSLAANATKEYYDPACDAIGGSCCGSSSFLAQCPSHPECTVEPSECVSHSDCDFGSYCDFVAKGSCDSCPTKGGTYGTRSYNPSDICDDIDCCSDAFLDQCPDNPGQCGFAGSFTYLYIMCMTIFGVFSTGGAILLIFLDSEKQRETFYPKRKTTAPWAWFLLSNKERQLIKLLKAENWDAASRLLAEDEELGTSRVHEGAYTKVSTRDLRCCTRGLRCCPCKNNCPIGWIIIINLFGGLLAFIFFSENDFNAIITLFLTLFNLWPLVYILLYREEIGFFHLQDEYNYFGEVAIASGATPDLVKILLKRRPANPKNEARREEDKAPYEVARWKVMCETIEKENESVHDQEHLSSTVAVSLLAAIEIYWKELQDEKNFKLFWEIFIKLWQMGFGTVDVSDEFFKYLIPTTSEEPADSFARLVQIMGPVPAEIFLRIVPKYVSAQTFLSYVDKDGRNVALLAQPAVQEAIESVKNFLGRYDIASAPPIHRSKTCIVVRAIDHGIDHGNQDGKSVVLKLMRNESQFHREIQARQRFALDPAHVVGVLRSHVLSDEDERFLLKVPAAAHLSDSVAGCRFCLVLPLGDRNLGDVLVHEHLAPSPNEVHWEEVRHIVQALAQALDGLHGKGVMHGDIKPLNVMRMEDGSWKLIDLDAAARLGEVGEVKQDEEEEEEEDSNALGANAGAKYSSAFCPPEMIYLAPDGTAQVKGDAANKGRLPDGDIEQGFDFPFESQGHSPVPASTAIDTWGLGVVLFHMSTGRSLFHGNQEDNLEQPELRALGGWTDREAAARAASIQHRLARHLVARLLKRRPADRLTMQQVLEHPFVTGKPPPGRLQGEEADFDVFLSYRVAADAQAVQDLHFELTKKGFKVFWDKVCLKAGKDWESGFCQGLVQSRLFAAVLSQAALYSGNPKRGDVSLLKSDSNCDNVLLELALASELLQRKLIERIVPVCVDSFPVDEAADVNVEAINRKLAQHLKRAGLGVPRQWGVRQVLQAVMQPKQPQTQVLQLDGAVGAIATSLETLGCVPCFDVCISFRQDSPDDEQQAAALTKKLLHAGVRARMVPASTAALGATTCPRVFVAIQSHACSLPLTSLSASSAPDGVAVEWALALQLHMSDRIDYLFPVFLGRPGSSAGEGRAVFSDWGAGAAVRVQAVDAVVCRLFESVTGSQLDPQRLQSSKQMLGVINMNQGEKVGGAGATAGTLARAAAKIRGIIERVTHASEADERIMELKAANARLTRINQQLKGQ